MVWGYIGYVTVNGTHITPPIAITPLNAWLGIKGCSQTNITSLIWLAANQQLSGDMILYADSAGTIIERQYVMIGY